MRSFVLTCLRSHLKFSSENSQELNQIASLAIRFRNEQGDNSLLLPRTNPSDSTAEVELETRVNNAAAIGSPIGTAASASTQEASNVSNQDTSNNTSKPRKQNQTTHLRPSNRPTKYQCGFCGQVARPPGRPHAAICPYKRCPVCGERRKDHNNNTFCPSKSKKSK